MMRTTTLATAALFVLLSFNGSGAFVAQPPARFANTASTSRSKNAQQQPLAASSLADEVDSVGNNMAVKRALEKASDEKLLTKVAASGLLSKAQKAGISLKNLEPLLALAAENPEILVLVEASAPEVLPLLPTAIELTPGLLPLLATAVSVPPPVIGAAGVGALAAAVGAVVVIPDDSVLTVALQTLIVGLALPVAGASLVGASVLGQLTKK